MLNDYSITNDGNATTSYLTIIKLLKDRGLIDLIGDPGACVRRLTEARRRWPRSSRRTWTRLAATGLPIYVTEFDIDGVVQVSARTTRCSCANYQRVFPVFWEHPAVKGITLWGYVQRLPLAQRHGAWLMYHERRRNVRRCNGWSRYVENKHADGECGAQTLHA